MEDFEIIRIWKAQDQKLDNVLAINQALIKETIGLKARKSLNGLVWLKSIGVASLVVYLLLLGAALLFAFRHYSVAWNYFIVSVSAIFLINLKAFADYIKHLIWANRINFDGSVLEIQKQLVQLRLSIINHSRTMCLQFPFFTTFFLSSNWFPGEVGWPYVVIQIALTSSFTWFSYWLYVHHKPQYLHIPLIKTFVDSSGGKSVEKALAFYKELEDFQRE